MPNTPTTSTRTSDSESRLPIQIRVQKIDGLPAQEHLGEPAQIVEGDGGIAIKVAEDGGRKKS